MSPVAVETYEILNKITEFSQVSKANVNSCDTYPILVQWANSQNVTSSTR